MIPCMNTKEKTAALSTILNILLTLFKFIMFGYTGSLAILAEAWHSFSDIATSFLVFIAVLEKNGTKGDKGAKGKKKRDNSFLEQAISLGIGLFLLVVSVLLIVKFFQPARDVVRNPLISGIIFLAFALASYFVYRFETSVGRSEKSVGLSADGMHSKADMVSSLIAGFSLILYHLGFDLDKWAAGLIALFILSFALETLINSSLSILKKERNILFSRRSHRVQTALMDKDNWVTLAEFLKSKTFLKALDRTFPAKALRILGALILLGFLGWLASTCFFTIAVTERGIVERFGRPLAAETPLGPGLHTKLPWPVDRAVLVEADRIRQVNIGNEVDANTHALLWTREHGTEIPFLSGDDNYFYPYLVIHYRIGSLYDFLYRHADPEYLLKAAAYRSVTRLFSTKSFYEIVLDYRRNFVRDVTAEVQRELDDLRAGIEIVSVNVKDVHPPIRVSGSFEKVIASIQEKEELINKALGLSGERLLDKKGEAKRAIEEAAAYRTDVRLRAQGDATRFLTRIPDEGAMTVTRKRLYLEALKEALAGRNKILIDPAAGSPEMWLNFDEALPRGDLEFDEARF